MKLGFRLREEKKNTVEPNSPERQKRVNDEIKKNTVNGKMRN